MKRFRMTYTRLGDSGPGTIRAWTFGAKDVAAAEEWATYMAKTYGFKILGIIPLERPNRWRAFLSRFLRAWSPR